MTGDGSAPSSGRLWVVPPAPLAPTDLDHASFSDTPPWTIDDPESLPWRKDLATVRRRVMDEVPRLTQPARWPPGARLVTVTRRLGTAVGMWALRERRAGGAASRAGISRRLR